MVMIMINEKGDDVDIFFNSDMVGNSANDPELADTGIDTQELADTVTIEETDPDWTSSDDASEREEINSKEESSSLKISAGSHSPVQLGKSTLSKAIYCKHCPFCKQQISSVADLISHVRSEHSFLGQRSCKRLGCQASFTSVISLLEHMINDHHDVVSQNCPLCNESVDRILDMKLHIRKSHLFCCLLCNEHFDHEVDLDKHYSLAHKRGNKFFCTICASTPIRRFPQHIDSHFDISAEVCRFCDSSETYRNRQLLTDHVAKLHAPENEDRLFLCPDCNGFKTTSAYYLVLHWRDGCNRMECRTCHRLFSSRVYRDSHQMTCQNPDNLIPCSQCHYKSKNRYTLNKHIHLRHEKHGRECELGPCAYCKSSLLGKNAGPKASHTSKIHIAVSQEKTPNQRRYKGQKMGYHHCEFPDCDSRFISSHSLKLHVMDKHHADYQALNKHGKKRQSLCKLCGLLLRNIEQLKVHLNAAHKNQRKAVKEAEVSLCDVCQRTFCSDSSLREHKKNFHGMANKKKETPKLHISQDSATSSATDAAVKIYRCQPCNFSSKSIQYLQRHYGTLTHQTITAGVATEELESRVEGEQPEPEEFRCDTCSFSTTYQSNLSRHIKNMHSNKKNKQRSRQSRSYRSLSCPLCDFVPITKGEITRKIRRHVFSAHQMQGEKVPPEWQSEGYQCPLCDYISYDNCRITRHMKIHARRAEVLPDGYVAFEMQTNHD